MKDLIEAAKAVDEDWHNGNTKVSHRVMQLLRAAVEQAEKPPADYEGWVRENAGKRGYLWDAWIAAQQAERERIKKILGKWVGGELMEKINESDSI